MGKREDYEAKTEKLIMPIVEANNVELFDVDYIKEGQDWYLRVYIDKEGGVTIDDCQAVSRAFNEILDKENYITDQYIFEVSSPGLTRPLKKEKDYAKSIGKLIDIKLYKAVEGLKEYTGVLKEYDKDNITIEIEHHAILHTCEWLEKHGYEVTYLDVDEYGKVDPIEFEAAIKDTTILASIMFANNEIGTVEPIKELGAIAHSKGVIFHTDAVQAFAHIPINVQEMNIDMLSASGHKFHGPKGIGFLYVSNKVKIGSFIHGGSQERSRRAGTHNVPGIIGMAKAASIANTNMSENIKNISAIRDHIIDRVLAEIPYSRVNGDRTDRLPGNVHFCFRFIEGESMLIMLDQKGICGSSGSACTSGSLDPSHVLLAIGLPHEIAHGSLRLSLGEDATIEDADYVVDELKGIVERLRSMSPLYEDFVKEQGK